jgi:hypothetical protein
VKGIDRDLCLFDDLVPTLGEMSRVDWATNFVCEYPLRVGFYAKKMQLFLLGNLIP